MNGGEGRRSGSGDDCLADFVAALFLQPSARCIADKRAVRGLGMRLETRALAGAEKRK